MPKRAPRHTKNRMSLLGMIVVLATLMGGMAAAMTFLPRPSVSAGDPVDPDNPFSSRFTVRNGNIPLSAVQISILSPKIVTTVNSRVTGGKWTREDWARNYLAMDDSFDITPADVFTLAGKDKSGRDAMLEFADNASIAKAELTILVEYNPWLVPIRRSKPFRFEARRQTNGKFYWYSIPAN